MSYANRTFEHISKDMQTVSGYIPSPNDELTSDAIKMCLFHLPRGYRQKAKWYMNTNTAKLLTTVVDEDGLSIVDERTVDEEKGHVHMMLGKPICIVESMPDIETGKVPIIFGDLSRGYLLARRHELQQVRRNITPRVELITKYGGQVLQPAAIKGIKITE